MKTSPTMQEIITALAAKHGIDLTQRDAHLRLEQPSYMPLVVETIGHNRIAVAHYFTQNGDAIADPEIEYFTGTCSAWLPIAITQIITGYREYAFLNEDSTTISQFYRKQQADLAAFSELWARNIIAQGWLMNGIRLDAGTHDQHRRLVEARRQDEVDFPF